MILSVWRKAHLALALVSCLFLLLVSTTGTILAVDVVWQKLPSYRVHDLEDINLAETISALRKVYPEITELTVDHHDVVALRAIDGEGTEVYAYVNPRTGEIIGTPKKEGAFIQWVNAFHRSLFLHETGRALVGIVAFLLLLITTSGIALIIQRQQGWRRFFAKIVFDYFAQYYHVVLGRLSLIPIFLIALSGTYLSMDRFDFFSEQPIKPVILTHEEGADTIQKEVADFPVFQQTKLIDVQKVEFPFIADDPEEYFTIKLKDREAVVSQFSGELLSETVYSHTRMLAAFSLNVHTGRTSILWALILALASSNILFFIYSGFAITLRRRANLVKNRFRGDECSHIILVGSENGSTFRFARILHEQLLEQGKKSFLTQLDEYAVFPKAEQLIVFAATYGWGESPSNARNFIKRLEETRQTQRIHYSVLGFGSRSYKDFCRFAFEVDYRLSTQQWTHRLLDVHTVSDKSPDDFRLWVEAWSQQSGIPLAIPTSLLTEKMQAPDTFVVTEKAKLDRPDGTFLIRLRTGRRRSFTSGDLLAIYPANDHRERLYSIGKVDGQLQLSVRLHPNGLGSGYLHNLTPGAKIRGRILTNTHFHFPGEATDVVMISNGTGIAPFLGMIHQNKAKTRCYLYCGFRNVVSFRPYEDFLHNHQRLGKLKHMQVAYSREGEKQYVSDLIARDMELILAALVNGGVLMICGSLAMQNDLFELLETCCVKQWGQNLSFYQSRGQILTDCY